MLPAALMPIKRRHGLHLSAFTEGEDETFYLNAW
jgi:hypothetical protein